MSALELFTYEGIEVRVVLALDGTPQFVAADVAAVLATPVVRVPQSLGCPSG